MRNFSFFLFFLCFPFLGEAQKKNMSIIDFLNIPGVSNPKLSPNGTELIYLLAKSDWEANKQIAHIWRVNLNGEDARQITYGSTGVSQAQWSPDGKYISFISKRNGDEFNQIYLMRVDGGEGRALTQHATAVSSYQWTTDNKSIYFLASDAPSKEEEAAKKLKDDVYAYDEDYKHRHLWKYNIETGKEQRITEGGYSILSFDLADDNQGVVVQKGPTPLFDNYKESEIWVMDANGANGRQLTNNAVGESRTRFSPDGKSILFYAFANEGFDFYYNSKLFLCPVNGSASPKAVMLDQSFDITSAEWSADGNRIYFLANMGAHVQLWEYRLSSNKATQLTKGKHTLGQWNYNATQDQHLMAKNTIENPGDIFSLKNGSLQQITHHFDYLQEEYKLPQQQLISWKGKDGVTVEGLIYFPHDYQAGQKYPLVVQTHGGPASSDKFGLSRSFTRYNPVLTHHGYVVLQPNYRGSTGYGDEFLRDMVGGYFRQSHLDVMTGVDHLIAQGIADPNRMVKMGWSAGGHMTNKIVTFTNRFKAASSGAGAVNWMGMYAQSDVRTYRTPWFGGSPWQKDAPTNVYWDHSPLKDISNVSTPTLVIVGGNDVRVPLPQSVEMYRAIRSLGVPTHLYVAPREPHGWRELRHRLYKINVELDWFAKYALEKDYEWEKAPAESTEE